MALIKCPECSREISDKAESCPQCGLPLTKVISETSASKTVNCLDCKKEFNFDAELCPHCGLFNSQKYKNSDKAAKEFTVDAVPNKPTDSNKNKSEFDERHAFILSLIIALAVGGMTSSLLIGFITFFVWLLVIVRVNYLAKHPNNKMKYERHIYTWKGIVAFILLVIAISSVQNFVDHHKEKMRKEQQLQERNNAGKEHLAQAKLLLAKAPNLSDDQWLNLNNHLAAIDSNAPDYAEARKLLPPVAKKRDEIVEKRLIEKRKQEKIEEKKRLEQEIAGLNAKGKRLKQKHPEWSVDECDTISKGKINIGMTKEQVAAAWGRPYHINKTHNAYGTHEQWVMHEMGSSYVYFEDGICTAIQN